MEQIQQENKDEVIDVKLGTHEENAWTAIKEAAEKEIETNRRSTLINEEIVKLAEKMIEIEKAKA